MLRLTLVFALAAVAALTLAGFLARWTQPFEIVSHFRLYFAFAAAGLVVALMLTREKRFAAIAGATLAINCAAVGYALTLGTGTFEAQATTRVIWANLFRRQASLDAIRDIAIAERVDIVALTELPPDGVAAVRRAFPEFQCFIASEGQLSPTATLIAARAPCAGGEAPTTYRPPAAQYADIGVLRIVAIHGRPPWNNERTGHRNAVIMAGARMAAMHDAGLLVGDFNAAPWSPIMIDLHKLGLRRIGCDGPFTRTWRSAQFPFYALPIDHVLVRGQVRVTSCRVGRDIGSDHRPLVFSIALRSDR